MTLKKFPEQTRRKGMRDVGNSSVLICREDRGIEVGAESLLLARNIPPCAFLALRPSSAIRSVLSHFLRALFRITKVGNLSDIKKGREREKLNN